MRHARLLLIASISLTSGCAGLIASCGKDLTALNTKEEIRAQLGEPDVTGVADGEPFEEYHTRRKISQRGAARYAGPGYAMALILTWGTIDLILVPRELYLASRSAILGQTIRVAYDRTDRVTDVKLDGEPLVFFGQTPSSGPAPENRSPSTDQPPAPREGATPTPR